MKVTYIVPGSGDTFYCENCLRDMVLIKALKKLGHDITVVPMYLPFFLDSPEVGGESPVFFGGVNAYLQQKFRLFRNTPRWIDRLFDAPWLLKRIAKKAGSTSADGLGEMTLSMLNGEHGRQAKELNRLIEWLKTEEKPDAVHISNALLAGIAGRIRSELSVPIVCTLQDEDGWLDSMDPPYGQLCWDAIASQSSDIDAFIAVSDYYADAFAKRAGLPREKVHTVHIGINIENYTQSDRSQDPAVIGFLSRMSHALGLDTLVDAFMILKREEAFKAIRLRLAGGVVGEDHRLIAGQKKRLAAAGFLDDVDFIVAFDIESRISMLRSLTVLSVPVRAPAAFGTYVIEALASGVPVVLPESGAFPELVRETQGGVLYQPNTAEALADAWRRLLNDKDELMRLGQNGRNAIRENFNSEKMATGIADIYSSIAGRHP